MSPRRKAALAACAVALVGVGQSQVRAAENEFLERFKGSWSGLGRVQRNAETSPWQVNCTLVGSPSENRIVIEGGCRVAFLIQRQIGAHLTYDPRSGSYRGIYIGARVGPARLFGRRSGDSLDLGIACPRPVNGSLEARMVIRNEGSGLLRISIFGNLSPGGPVQQTSELVLRKR
jgi:hypothetical protein